MIRKNIFYKIIRVASCIFILYACDSSTKFGVAGSSWDSNEAIAELNEEKEFISERIKKETLWNECGGTNAKKLNEHTQHFSDIFRKFQFSSESVGKNWIEVSNFSFSYTNNIFRGKKEGVDIIQEKLPLVFNMHPIRLGIDSLGDMRIIMIVNKSRATTRRYFVGIYSQDGDLLYRNVLTTKQVWDISKDETGINILGCGETIRLAYSH